MFSLILPTYNESENISELVPEIERVLEGIDHELIIVDDDSPDRTWKVAQDLAKRHEAVHVIRRIGRKGLSSAIIEGFLASKGDVLAVMDADGQHDMQLLTKLHDAVSVHHGIALGSRYVDGGGVGDWDERRYRMSRLATKLALSLCKVQVSDPMSGFFAIDRDLFESVIKKLNPKGFKILLDLLVVIPSTTPVTEVPFTFGERKHGESKLSWRVQLDFVEYLYDVTFGKYVPLTFVKYCIVGGLGVGVHLATYALVSHAMTVGGTDLNLMGFSVSVIAAIETAVVFNFILNNMWTFAHTRLTGMRALIGFLKFNGACLLGALANFGVSAFLFSRGYPEFVSVIIGAAVGVFWNYTMNRIITWRE